MKKTSKLFIISIVTIALIGFIGYNYVMHGGERDLTSEETTFTVSSKTITAEFVANVDLANKKYLDKAIAISGTITDTTGKEVVLDHTIICSLKDFDTYLQKNQTVTLKGRVVGYDDLLGELKLDQCYKAL